MCIEMYTNVRYTYVFDYYSRSPIYGCRLYKFVNICSICRYLCEEENIFSGL